MNNFRSISGTLLGASFGIPISFTLEVCGSAGAFWGCTQIVGLRNDENEDYFIAAAAFLAAGGFLYHLANHVEKTINYSNNNSGFFRSFTRAIRNPYGAIYNQIKQCCQKVDDEEITYEYI